MKKIVTMLSVILLGCGPSQHDADGNFIAGSDTYDCYHDFSIVTVKANGEVHEYLMFRVSHAGGITHLPNCKYCKGEQ